MPVGGSASVAPTLTVSPARTSGPIDIFFLSDTTKSMEHAIASVKAGAAGILGSTTGFGDIRWGVGEYRDVDKSNPSAWVYRTNQALTSNMASVQAGINQWSPSDGKDLPEANLFALQQVATAAEIGWRAGSTRILAWFGDAPGHDTNKDQPQLHAAIDALGAAHIKVEAIDVGVAGTTQSLNYSPAPGITGQATEIVTATGGSLFSGVTSASIVDEIQRAIGVAINTYHTVCLETPEIPAGVQVVASACINGAFDRTVERTFNFSLSFTGLSEGSYDFNAYATIDGGRVASETERLLVGLTTPTTAVPLPGSAPLMLAALTVLFATRRLGARARAASA